MADSFLEWVKVVGPIVVSWPTVAILVVVLMKGRLLKLADRFCDSSGSKAELGPIKIELGNPVIPPQYRSQGPEKPTERIDLSATIGAIRDTGPEGTTVGFALAYALQSEILDERKEQVTISPRGIYVLAKKYDEFPGEDYEGTSIKGGLIALREIGAYLEEDWPYDRKLKPLAGRKPAYRISDYADFRGVENVLNALREGKVVVAQIRVTDDFDRTDVHGHVTVKLPARATGSKAICIVGYDATSAEFTFASDWGTNWGRKGFGIIRDTDLAKILDMAYTLELRNRE